jgi:hypothetical protein
LSKLFLQIVKIITPKNKEMKKIILVIITSAFLTACSKDDNSSCKEIVCGTPGNNFNGVYYIYKGTIDNCGETELQVNEATFLYYQAKWQASPEGYTCWEGLK